MMPDYHFDFGSISDGWAKTPVTMMRSQGIQKERCQFYVSLKDQGVLASSLKMPSNAADLMDLAIGVFVPDRRSRRLPDKEHQIHTHSIGIRLPLRNTKLFIQLQKELEELLHYFTEDQWEFQFVPRHGQGRVSESQYTLWQPQENIEVALFSGGLDSLAGLINRIHEHPSIKYILIGGGAHSGAFETQKQVFHELKRRFPKTEMSLIQLRIGQSGTKDIPADPDFRTRGLAFMLFGAACAIAHGQTRLYIYENGIGAYNFPPRSSGVGLDHSLAVHPLSLLRVGDFISQVIGRRFEIINPFETWTKGQMCGVLRKYALADLAARTVSCDKASHGHSQCGTCASCILRRQALIIAGIADKTYYTLASDEDDERDAVLRRSDLPSMLFGAQKLNVIFACANPWQEFSRQHPSRGWDAAHQIAHYTGELKVTIIDRILSVHHNYAMEWDMIRNQFAAEVDAIRGAKRRAIDEKGKRHEVVS